MQIDRHQAAFCFNCEMCLLRLARRMEIAREDAEPIAGFFRFAAVRVEDPQPEIRFFGGDECKNPVTAQSPITITEECDVLRCEFETEFFRIQDDVVVAQAVAAKESILHAHLLEQPLMRQTASEGTWSRLSGQ